MPTETESYLGFLAQIPCIKPFIFSQENEFICLAIKTVFYFKRLKVQKL